MSPAAGGTGVSTVYYSDGRPYPNSANPLVVTIPAGASYTATVSGVNGSTGEALVEIYELQ